MSGLLTVLEKYVDGLACIVCVFEGVPVINVIRLFGSIP